MHTKALYTMHTRAHTIQNNRNFTHYNSTIICHGTEVHMVERLQLLWYCATSMLSSFLSLGNKVNLVYAHTHSSKDIHTHLYPHAYRHTLQHYQVGEVALWLTHIVVGTPWFITHTDSVGCLLRLTRWASKKTHEEKTTTTNNKEK